MTDSTSKPPMPDIRMAQWTLGGDDPKDPQECCSRPRGHMGWLECPTHAPRLPAPPPSPSGCSHHFIANKFFSGFGCQYCQESWWDWSRARIRELEEERDHLRTQLDHYEP